MFRSLQDQLAKAPRCANGAALPDVFVMQDEEGHVVNSTTLATGSSPRCEHCCRTKPVGTTLSRVTEWTVLILCRDSLGGRQG